MSTNDNRDDTLRDIFDNATATQGQAYAAFTRLVTLAACMQTTNDLHTPDARVRRLSRDAWFDVMVDVGCALGLTSKQMHAAITTAMTALSVREQQ